MYFPPPACYPLPNILPDFECIYPACRPVHPSSRTVASVMRFSLRSELRVRDSANQFRQLSTGSEREGKRDSEMCSMDERWILIYLPERRSCAKCPQDRKLESAKASGKSTLARAKGEREKERRGKLSSDILRFFSLKCYTSLVFLTLLGIFCILA